MSSLEARCLPRASFAWGRFPRHRALRLERNQSASPVRLSYSSREDPRSDPRSLASDSPGEGFPPYVPYVSRISSLKRNLARHPVTTPASRLCQARCFRIGVPLGTVPISRQGIRGEVSRLTCLTSRAKPIRVSGESHHHVPFEIFLSPG